MVELHWRTVRVRVWISLLCLVAAAWLANSARCQTPAELNRLFSDAARVDLRTSRASSVAKLREVVKVPAPDTVVLVKTYAREALPQALQAVFAKPGTAGVTMNGRYVAIIRTDYAREHNDVLNHELVHAYITLASPKPLPFWFQEASAVYFSTNADRRIYGRPSDKLAGVTEAKIAVLPEDYQRKLQNFRFLIERVGEKRFYEWYRDAIAGGVVDARPLLGLSRPGPAVTKAEGHPRLVWLAVFAGVIMLAVLIGGFVAARRSGDFG